MYLRAAVCSHLSLSGYLPIKPDKFQRLTPDGIFQHLLNLMKKYIICTFLVKRECEMMPRSLIRLLAQFCEGFGQTCYMIKISGKRGYIWLNGTVKKRFKSWQSFCTESISTRLLSSKPDHRHPWLTHGLLELSLLNSCFATFLSRKILTLISTWTGWIVARRGKSRRHNVTMTRQVTVIVRPYRRENFQLWQVWTIPSPTVNPESSYRTLLDYPLTQKHALYWCVSLAGPNTWTISSEKCLQEARKEGFFAGLSSGLASGEHLPRHMASRVMMWIFMPHHRVLIAPCLLAWFVSFSRYWVTSFWLQQKSHLVLWRWWVCTSHHLTNMP